jgi:hypothetical protein
MLNNNKARKNPNGRESEKNRTSGKKMAKLNLRVRENTERKKKKKKKNTKSI